MLIYFDGAEIKDTTTTTTTTTTTKWNKSSYTQIFLLLSLMRNFGPQTLFYAIWNKGFLDYAHLTDGMQWQKKSKKHIYIYIYIPVYIDAFYTLDVFCESECSSR